MNPRLRAVIVLAGIAVVCVGAVAFAMAATPHIGLVHAVQQPTSPPSTAAGSVSTTTIVTPTAVTGPGPDSFTTLTVPGPVQVLVRRASCGSHHAGEGWDITYRVHNEGQARTGALFARIDASGEPLYLAPALTLKAGQDLEATAVVKGNGDSVMLTWATADRPVQSFPLELPTCPTDPADIRQAAKQTTTT